MTQNPDRILVSAPAQALWRGSAFQRTFREGYLRWNAVSLCNRCADQPSPVQLRFFASFFQFCLCFLQPVISIWLFQTPFPYWYSASFVQKNCRCFCVFVESFTVFHCKSRIIVLSSFDLDLSQVSISIIGESLFAVDGRLCFYYCLWFEFVTF